MVQQPLTELKRGELALNVQRDIEAVLRLTRMVVVSDEMTTLATRYPIAHDLQQAFMKMTDRHWDITDAITKQLVDGKDLEEYT